MPGKKKKYLWILIGVWALLFLVHLDVLPVNIMEARNFISAREMLELDNWVLTTLNDQPRYEKPPLPTWLTAICAGLMGYDLFPLRLPAALASLLLLYYFFRFLPRTSVSQKQAFLSSLVLASSFYILFAGRNGQWDIFTHAFMMGAIFYLWKFFQSDQMLYSRALLAGLYFGCSLLSKGPVSLYALLLPFLIAFGGVYGFRKPQRRWRPLLLFLATGILLGGWWFLYVRLVDPVAFLKIASKETTNWGSYNTRPFYYYWNFFVQSGMWTLPAFVGLLYPYLKNKVANKKAYLFSVIWTLSAVLLLSLIPEKKSRYLLPVLIPLACTTGFYIEYLFRSFPSLPPREKWIPYFNFGLIGSIGLLFPFAAPFILELEGHWGWFIPCSLVLFGLGAGMWYFLVKQRFPIVFYLSIAFICAIMVFGFPLTGALVHNPRFRNFAGLERSVDLPVYVYRTSTPELVWDHGKPISILSLEEIKEVPEEAFRLMVMEQDTAVLRELDAFEVRATERYDLNFVHPDKPGYRDRLIRKVYVLERREP